MNPTGSRHRMRWGRIILAAAAVPVADLTAITVVVTAYAFRLAFQARGAPDQVRITQFAAEFGRSSWFVLAVILTLLAAAWVARRAPRMEKRHGLAVGVIAGISTSLPGFGFSMRNLGEFALTVAAGAVGGWLAGRVGRTGTRPSGDLDGTS